MTDLTALVVDDESAARSRMKRLLSGFDGLEVIGEAENGLEALEKTALLKPDVVFLDIDMPELSGLAAARALPHPGPMVVFATAYDEHALAAFEASAIDYLVKPITTERLERTVRRLQEGSRTKSADLDTLLQKLQPATDAQRLAVRCGTKYVVFNPKNVSAILAQDHYATIIEGERELLSEESLDAIIKRLSPDHFLRIHRSAVINVSFLAELQREGDRKYTAILNDKRKTRTSISRERLKDVKSRLGLT